MHFVYDRSGQADLLSEKMRLDRSLEVRLYEMPRLCSLDELLCLHDEERAALGVQSLLLDLVCQGDVSVFFKKCR